MVRGVSYEAPSGQNVKNICKINELKNIKHLEDCQKNVLMLFTFHIACIWMALPQYVYDNASLIRHF